MGPFEFAVLFGLCAFGSGFCAGLGCSDWWRGRRAAHKAMREFRHSRAKGRAAAGV